MEVGEVAFVVVVVAAAVVADNVDSDFLDLGRLRACFYVRNLCSPSMLGDIVESYRKPHVYGSASFRFVDASNQTAPQ